MSWILRANGMGRARVSERERGSKEKEKPSGLRQIGGKLSEKWEKKKLTSKWMGVWALFTTRDVGPTT